jgi:hypothetical protein
MLQNYPYCSTDYAMRCLTYAGDLCETKSYRHLSLWRAQNEESGMIRENCVSTFMYTGLDDTMGDTCLEVATFHDLLFPPNEKTGYLRQVLDCQGRCCRSRTYFEPLYPTRVTPPNGNACVRSPDSVTLLCRWSTCRACESFDSESAGTFWTRIRTL